MPELRKNTTMNRPDRTPRLTLKLEQERRITNADRVARADSALVNYPRDTEPETAICDLLADLRHYCDANAMDFGEQDRLARMHYLAELMEERDTMPTPSAFSCGEHGDHTSVESASACIARRALHGENANRTK